MVQAGPLHTLFPLLFAPVSSADSASEVAPAATFLGPQHGALESSAVLKSAPHDEALPASAKDKHADGAAEAVEDGPAADVAFVDSPLQQVVHIHHAAAHLDPHVGAVTFRLAIAASDASLES